MIKDNTKTRKRRKDVKNIKHTYKKPSKAIKKKQFLYNPNDPKKSFDVYIDKNPDDTIPIKYTTVDDVRNTINNLELLYKNHKYPHKRIWQVGMIMKVRLHAIYKKRKTKYKGAKNITRRYNLSKKYFNFLSKRTKASKTQRFKMTFNK